MRVEHFYNLGLIPICNEYFDDASKCLTEHRNIIQYLGNWVNYVILVVRLNVNSFTYTFPTVSKTWLNFDDRLIQYLTNCKSFLQTNCKYRSSIPQNFA